MASSALVLPSSLIDYGSGVLRPALDRAVPLLDAVHLAPARAQLPLRAVRRKNGQIGTFRRGRSLVVNSHYSETTRVKAILHEYAHFLDCMLLPGLGYTSEQETGPLRRVVELCRESAPAEEIRRRASYWTPGRADWRCHRDGWLEQVSPAELFARAYSQWLAWQGDDEELLAHYPDERPPLDHESRWSRDEFAPVAKALERAFADLDWLR